MESFAKNELLQPQCHFNKTKRFVTDQVGMEAQPKDEVLQILFDCDNLYSLQKQLQDEGYGMHTIGNIMEYLHRDYEHTVMAHSIHFPIDIPAMQLAEEIRNRAYRSIIHDITSFRSFDKFYQKEIRVLGTRPMKNPIATMVNRGTGLVYNRW